MKKLLLIAGLLCPAAQLIAEDKEESSPSATISNLFTTLKENVKDIDMSAIPKQISEMKANYTAQGETLAQLKSEMEAMKKELEALRQEVAALKAAKKN